MRVLFVYPNQITNTEQPLGLMYLSAVLKKHGHDTSLFYLTATQYFQFDQEWPTIERRFLERICSFKPDLIGFMVVTPTYSKNVALARSAKDNTNAKIIFGGPHASIAPEATIAQDVVDMICVGEGEYPLLDLVTKLENGEDITTINNIWVKQQGQTCRNPIRNLSEDLDNLPHPDRALLDEFYQGKEKLGISIMTSRGCPYKCTYCHNPAFQELYRSKGRYVRFRTVRDVVAEAREVVSSYRPSCLVFSDDMFTLKKSWVIDFCEAYRLEVGLPFWCLTRADVVDEEVFAALKSAGCELVSMGIEAGNEQLRNEVLGRGMSTAAILRAYELAKAAGLKTGSFNIIGVPFETDATIWDTINLNRAVGPVVLHCTMLIPLEKTRIREICEEQGWLARETATNSYYADPVFEQPSMPRNKLLGYQRVFDLYVKLPKVYYPFLHLLRFLWAQTPESESWYWRPIMSLKYRMTGFARTRLLSTKSLPALMQ